MWGLVASIGGSLLGGLVQSRSASRASNAQTASANAGIAAQERQFAALQKLLRPYVTAGTGALDAQEDILGLDGAAQQRSAIANIQRSPQFAALMQQGENSILQNASATGGLRGGNTQGALAQFRPQLLSALIDQQFARLGGLTSIGANAAAGVGNAGMQTGTNIGNLYGQMGAAQAGNALAQGAAINSSLGSLTGAFGRYIGGQPTLGTPSALGGPGIQFGGTPIQGNFLTGGI
jgi:hypothetical protein